MKYLNFRAKFKLKVYLFYLNLWAKNDYLTQCELEFLREGTKLTFKSFKQNRIAESFKVKTRIFS